MGDNGLVWRKATASEPQGGCVEVARDGDLTLVRDSKDPLGPFLTYTPVEWQAFLDGVRAGEFDL